MRSRSMRLIGTAACLTFATVAFADKKDDDGNGQGNSCRDLPGFSAVQSALSAVVASAANGGLGFNMWASVVNRDGVVCLVTFTGTDRGSQWPGSRVISA